MDVISVAFVLKNNATIYRVEFADRRYEIEADGVVVASGKMGHLERECVTYAKHLVRKAIKDSDKCT